MDYGNGYSVSLTETEVGDVYDVHRLSVAVDDKVEVCMFVYTLHSRSNAMCRLLCCFPACSLTDWFHIDKHMALCHRSCMHTSCVYGVYKCCVWL